MEDAWLFVRDDNMVTKALEVFRAEPNVAQVSTRILLTAEGLPTAA